MAANYSNDGPVTITRDVGRDIVNIHGIDAENVNFYLPATENFWQVLKREVCLLTGNGDGPKVAAAVKSLGEKLELQLEKDNNRLHFVIFNLSQSYWKELNGLIEYQEHHIYGILFGVWLFEYGQFENLGTGSYENWRFGGYKGGNWNRSGEPIKLFRKSYFPWIHKYGDGGRLVTFSKIK